MIYSNQIQLKQGVYKVEWAKKHKVLTVLAIIIVLAVIGSAMGGSDTSNNQSDNESQSAQPTDESQATVAKMGEPARDGKFEFIVKKVDCGKSSVGDEFFQETAQGQYCLLSVSIKNIGDEPQSLFSDNQYLYNADGQKYTTDDGATIANSPNNDSWYSEINPGNQVEGVIVFDIPKGQKPTKAELHDSAFSNGIEVKLN